MYSLSEELLLLFIDVLAKTFILDQETARWPTSQVGWWNVDVRKSNRGSFVVLPMAAFKYRPKVVDV